MSSKQANQLEQALEQAVRGEMVKGPIEPLVHTAQRLSTLAAPPPPAPYKLAPGRQRFLAQAAAMRHPKTSRKARFWPMTGAARLASGLTVAVLVLSLVLGAGQAMADSLPGDPLYGLKLLVTEQRLKWTNDPQARMDLALDVVGERLNEIAETIETGQTIDSSTSNMLQKHMGMALDTAGEGAQGPLQTQTMEQNQLMLQSLHQRMIQAMGTVPDPEPLRALAQEAARLRLEIHAGSGDAQGQQLGSGSDESNAKDAEELPVPGENQGIGAQVDEPSGSDAAGPYGPGPKPEETPTGDEAPVSAGPGPGPEAPDDTSGTGPAQQQTGPNGPTQRNSGSGSQPNSRGERKP